MDISFSNFSASKANITKKSNGPKNNLTIHKSILESIKYLETKMAKNEIKSSFIKYLKSNFLS